MRAMTWDTAVDSNHVYPRVGGPRRCCPALPSHRMVSLLHAHVHLQLNLYPLSQLNVVGVARRVPIRLVESDSHGATHPD